MATLPTSGIDFPPDVTPPLESFDSNRYRFAVPPAVVIPAMRKDAPPADGLRLEAGRKGI